MINFNVELEGFKPKDVRKKKQLLKDIITEHGFKLGELNYIFLTDEDLLKVNIEYLDHDTYTDIITFDNSDDEDVIEGDIFISIDRVKENAKEFGVDFETEFVRVLAHGVLHLCGYKDKDEEDVLKMRAGEEKAIKKYLEA